jgi:phosphoglycolate phosphatase
VSRVAWSAVIFDLDGTLLDTLADLADSMNSVLEALGYPTHPVDAYRNFVGDGVTNLVKRALPPEWHERAHGEHGFLEKCVDSMREAYELRWAIKTAPYAGIPELLRELGLRGIRMAVLSNKPHDFTAKIVAHFLGSVRFGAVLGAREGVPRKPDPAGVRDALRMLGVPDEETLYVGDSSTDMDTARNAGLISVGVLWGFRTEEELLEHGAHHLVAKPRELLRYFPGNA